MTNDSSSKFSRIELKPFMKLDYKNTSAESRKEKPPRGVPIIAQGKSAPSGRRPGFRSRNLTSAECLLGVQNPRRSGRNRASSVSASATLLRYTEQTARPMKMVGFLPRAAAQFAIASVGLALG